jgi:hypothetical protein
MAFPNESASITSATDFADTPEGWQSRWNAEVTSAKKAAKKWRKVGERVTRVFLDDREAATHSMRITKLNVFSANIITQRAMLFGNVPRVEVGRRFEDANDDAARVAAELLERIANADIGKQFSFAIGQALDDRLLVGFGLARVRYAAEFKSVQQEAIRAEDGTELAPAYTVDTKTAESVPVDYINWRDVLWSPARTWDEVRWIAFRNYMTRDQCVKRFGKKIGMAIPLEVRASGNERKDERPGIKDDPWQRGEVWEIWSLEDKTVFWFAEGMEVICDAKKDPLQLEQFFPCPQFMLANPTSKAYVPRCDYTLAEDQYVELNDVTSRITMLQRALKAVGLYDKTADGIQRMLTEGTENELIPVENWAGFSEKGGIGGAIQWMPLQDIASTLASLVEYRGQLIQLLFQVTGMSDIIRGQTDPGETLGAQQLKAKFASVRMQQQQDDFARFATDLQKLRIEIMAKHFDDASLLKESAMEQSLDAQYLPQAIALIRSLDVFRIAIKSEQLAAQDMAALRQEKAEFIQGLAMFLQAAQPMIEKYPASAPTLLEMLKWSMTGFKGSATIEGVLDRAIASLQQSGGADGKPDEKAAAEKAATQGKIEVEKVKGAIQSQHIQQQTQADLMRINAETQGQVKQQAAEFAFSPEQNAMQQAGIRGIDAMLNQKRSPQ